MDGRGSQHLDLLGLNEDRKRHRRSSIRTWVIDPVKVPAKVDLIAPVDQIWVGTGRFAARWFGCSPSPKEAPEQIGNGTGRFVARWFGCGRLEQSTPKEVDGVGSPRLLSGSRSRLRHTIGNGFPLPFACIQEHHFFPQFAGWIASAPLSFGVPQSYEGRM